MYSFYIASLVGLTKRSNLKRRYTLDSGKSLTFFRAELLIRPCIKNKVTLRAMVHVRFSMTLNKDDKSPCTVVVQRQ